MNDISRRKDLLEQMKLGGIIDDASDLGRMPILGTAPGGVVGGVLGSSAGAARKIKKELDLAERQLGAILEGYVGISSQALKGLRSSYDDILGASGGAKPATADAGEAGSAIESALHTWTNNFRATSGKMYDEADAQLLEALTGLAEQRGVPIDQLKISGAAVLQRMEDLIPEGSIAESLASQQLFKLKTAFKEQMDAEGMVPWSAMKDIRRVLAKKMNNKTLMDDAPQGDIKSLWETVTTSVERWADDLDKIAGTSVGRSMKEASKHYREGRTMLDDNLRFVTLKLSQKGAAPEDLFEALMSASKRTPSRINDLMNVIDEADGLAMKAAAQQRAKLQGMFLENPEMVARAKRFGLDPDLTKEFEQLANSANASYNAMIVQSAVVSRMGQSRASSLKPFSMSTFLTRFNEMDPKAFARLFKNDPVLANNLKAFARIAGRQRQQIENAARVNDVIAGISQFGLAGGAGALAGGLGVIPVVGGAMLSMVGAHEAGRLMTNRSFLQYLIKHQNSAFGSAAIADLVRLGEENPDIAPDLQEMLLGMSVATGAAR
jgi:hypothetical protein